MHVGLKPKLYISRDLVILDFLPSNLYLESLLLQEGAYLHIYLRTEDFYYIDTWYCWGIFCNCTYFIDNVYPFVQKYIISTIDI